jgi:hypothetical protein
MKWPANCAFIRGLWGSTEIDRFKNKTLKDVATSLTRKYQFPYIAYVYGRENAEYLKSLGIRARVMSEEPFAWQGTEPEFDRQFGRMAFGVSAWRHKLLIIRQALTEFRDVIWCDWDCHALAPLPRDLWHRFRAGQPLQICIRQYKRIKCPWRNRNQRTLGSGAFIYCRDVSLIDHVLQVNDEHPTWDDEICIGYVLDEYAGGWPGSDEYLKRGFVPWCYYIRGTIFEPEQRLFTAS